MTITLSKLLLLRISIFTSKNTRWPLTMDGWLSLQIKLAHFGYYQSNMDMQYISPENKENPIFAWSLFYLERETVRLRREYKKLQSLVAEVGGIMKFIMVFGTFLIKELNLCYIKLNLLKIFTLS